MILRNGLIALLSITLLASMGTSLALSADAGTSVAISFAPSVEPAFLIQDPPPEPEPEPEPDPDEPDPDEPDDPEPIYEEPMGNEPTEPPVDTPSQQPVDRGARPSRTRPEMNRPQRPVRNTEQRPRRTPADARKTATPADNSSDKPRVAFDIEIEERPMGRVVIEVDTDGSPNTAQNFLDYVDAGFYNNTIFHRIVQDFIVQGGGFTTLDTPKTEGLREPIKNEAKPLMHHNRGTIAAARVHRKRDSATSQFFINLDDNNKLDRQWYCVFGRVVEGMELVERLGETPTDVSELEGPRYKTKPMVAPKIARAYRYGSSPGGSERPPAAAASVPADRTRDAVTNAGPENANTVPAAAMPPEPAVTENQVPTEAATPPDRGARNAAAQRRTTPRDNGNPIPSGSDEDAAIRQRLIDQVMNDPNLSEEEKQEGLKNVEMLMQMRKMGGSSDAPAKPARERTVKPVENKRPPQTGSRSPG
ncbi:MAG: peptidylprolyl isomerase [Phycisphaerae bacterium]